MSTSSSLRSLVTGVARAIVNLTGEDAAYITGIDVRLDGGLCDGHLATIPRQTALEGTELKQPHL
jgi:hypothetical protein